jgi:Fur family transcriptional regulator, iron response regulator
MAMSLTVPANDGSLESTAVGADTEVPSELVFGVGCDNRSRHDCEDLLRQAGLRPTRQRLMLGGLLFSNGGRHVTAETLYAEATRAGTHISLATVYNTLHQFTDAGLLRQIGVDGLKSFFDTNPTIHQHFFVDNETRLFDVPEPGVVLEAMPQPLPGYEISRVDVIVHLRRKQNTVC